MELEHIEIVNNLPELKGKDRRLSMHIPTIAEGRNVLNAQYNIL